MACCPDLSAQATPAIDGPSIEDPAYCSPREYNSPAKSREYAAQNPKKPKVIPFQEDSPHVHPQIIAACSCYGQQMETSVDGRWSNRLCRIAPPTEERLNVLAPYVTNKAPFDEPQILRVLYPLLPSKTLASLDVCAGQK